VLLALLSWPLLLNTNGIYWDDWTLIGQPVNQVATVMLSLGAWFAAAIHATLLSLGNGIVSYRIACFSGSLALPLPRRAESVLPVGIAIVQQEPAAGAVEPAAVADHLGVPAGRGDIHHPRATRQALIDC
jgi:hypothetical protein